MIKPRFAPISETTVGTGEQLISAPALTSGCTRRHRANMVRSSYPPRLHRFRPSFSPSAAARYTTRQVGYGLLSRPDFRFVRFCLLALELFAFDSPTALTFSRPVRNRIASAEPPR